MKISTFLILGFLAALLLDFFYWAVIRKRWTLIKTEFGHFLEKHLHVTSKDLLEPPNPKPREKLNRGQLFTAVEIILILAFALWVGRAYLNFDETVWPTGYEFGTSIRTHYYWIKFEECGLCFLWDGSIKGGAPSMADLHGSWLHPLAAVSTLIFGYVNGTKVILLACLFMAGLAQWWLSKQMKVGVVSRIFTAFMAVAAGNLAATMELGNLGRLLSFASAALALAGGFAFTQKPDKKRAAVFGILLALLLISGQSYNQAGFFLAIFPSLLVLIPAKLWKEKSTWKNLLLACLAMVLLAGFFIVPMVHFIPQISKWTASADFDTAQSIQYIPLNLVISDYAFYSSEVYGKLPYVSFYALYIGWIPVFLALCAFIFLRKENLRLYSFFVLSIVLVLLAGSGITFRLLARITDMAYNFRFPSILSGFLVPLVLGLAAIGLDKLLNRKFFNREVILPARLHRRKIPLNFALIVLLLPLFFSIRSAYQFGHRWYSVVWISADNDSAVFRKLKLDHTEWTSLSFESHATVYPMLVNDLKFADSFRTWWWKDHPDPLPYIKLYENLTTVLNPQNEYASILFDGESIPCIAHANAGYIKVHCSTASGGMLTVMENYWPGWKVWANGKPVKIAADQQWLTLHAEPGEHDYIFRYLPMDVLVGYILTLIGIGLAVFMLVKTDHH